MPAAVGENVGRIRAATGSAIMAVVKADGYGHGAVAVARAAVGAGATWLGITDIADAVELRAAGLEQPILAWLHPGGIDAALAGRLRVDVAVASVAELRGLIAELADEAGRRVTAARPVAALRRTVDQARHAADQHDESAHPLRVHLHVDTGMARGGCPFAEWRELLRAAREGQDRGLIEVVAVMGHLPLADRADPAANAPAVLRMRQARDAVLRAGFGPVIVHLAATAGALTDPATHFDLVRVGAGLVGIDPSGTVELASAGRLTAPVVHTSLVPAGTSVGYGAAHTTSTATNLAIVGVGYADGIPRELAAGACVEIGGSRHPIVGRVSMDQIVVDTGSSPVELGARATVFGPGGVVPSIQEWAEWAGTIPHTIVTGIGPRIRRRTA